MKIPRYWAKETRQLTDARGKTISYTCWRWSWTSPEEARRFARDRLEEIARKLRSHEKLDRYSYGERPLREEIIEVITNREQKEIAVITRNAYGSLVLNAANAMFIDIDFEEGSAFDTFRASLRRLFGKKTPGQEEKGLQAVEHWAQSHPDWGLRVYRTRAGLRCLVTDRLCDPTRDSTVETLESLGCDPLYIRLCRNQECFRARLTPKPWRCGSKKPPSRYPWESTQDEIWYRQWEETYNVAASQYGTCKLVREIGNRRVHPDIAAILSTHDRYTGTDQDRKLA